jgi:hypothetical protein
VFIGDQRWKKTTIRHSILPFPDTLSAGRFGASHSKSVFQAGVDWGLVACALVRQKAISNFKFQISK